MMPIPDHIDNPLVCPTGNPKKATHRPRVRFTDLTPERIEQAADAYIEYCDANPLLAEKAFAYKGIITTHQEPRMQASTVMGFCVFTGIAQPRWYEWKAKDADIGLAMTVAEKRFQARSVNGAAADKLNANIISRVFGLADATKVETADVTPDKGPEVPSEHIANMTHPDMTDEQLTTLTEAGIAAPLFSKAQIDAGMPFHMPEVPDG